MGIFISAGKTAECVVIAFVFACFLTLISYKTMGVLQACGYKGASLFKWAGRKNNMCMSRFMLLSFATLLSSAVISLCFSFTGQWSAIIGLVAYVAFFILYIYADARHSVRSQIVLTSRFKRLFVVTWLLYAVFAYLAITLLNFADYVWGNALFTTLKYCALALFPVAVLPFVCAANAVTLIYEIPKNKSYVKKAKAKLASSGATVIGITGSYGKTSVKNILSRMLSKKYKTVATPQSYNTPLGIAKTINSTDLEGCQIFIAEMGARNIGDIAELCALCPPDYSVITGICPQHLESFKTLENVISAKGEIITATKNVCVIADDCYDYFEGVGGAKTRCGCVSDVKADCTGTEFKLTLGGETRTVKTGLLGAHSAANAGLCACLAYELGVPFGDIARAIEEMDFVEHRLQLTQSNGVNILDDGYNSNVVGAAAALEVLRTFSGKKIVVTPGLVELGVLEESENARLGERLVGLDKVILVGETLVGAIRQGYIDGGGDEEKITVVPTLAAAQDVLKGELSSGDAVLFLNDLPEIYN